MSISNYDGVIKAVGKGNMNALELLYDDLSKTVFALAYSILKNRELAEDAMQETFIRVKLSAGDYSSRGKGRAWVLKIARNTALNLRAKAKRETSIEEVSENKLVSESGENKLIDCVMLEAAMRVLSRDEREIVLLHTGNGMLHREISQIVGRPVGTVKWMYSKALKKLAAEISLEE